MVTAIILAAGESQRMKSPKALLQIDSETFAGCIARKIRACGIDEIQLVAGAHVEKIRSVFQSATLFEIIFNPKYKEGQISSLQEGLRQISEMVTAALVWPVDQPLVKEDTVSQLLKMFAMKKGRITIPSYNGRKGHPVIYAREAIVTLLSLTASQTGKDLQAIYKGEISIVEVEDPAILIDIDTPEDYARHIKRADP